MGVFPMGFFPIIIFWWIVDHIIESINNNREKREREHCKKTSCDSKTETYLDQYCTTRSIKDDSYVRHVRNVYGEIEYKYSDGTVRNLAQEEYNKKSGTVTQLVGYGSHDAAVFMREAIGHRYKDRNNGKIYVIRELEYKKGNGKWFHFYVNVTDGSIERPTDGQLELERRAKAEGKKYYTAEDFLSMKKYFDDNRCLSRPALLFRNNEDSVDLSEESIIHALKFRKEI